jgi:hypothetical protein
VPIRTTPAVVVFVDFDEIDEVLDSEVSERHHTSPQRAARDRTRRTATIFGPGRFHAALFRRHCSTGKLALLSRIPNENLTQRERS